MLARVMRVILFCVFLLVLLWITGSAQRSQSLLEPSPGSPFAVGRGPADLAVGDVNGDGRPDIVAANSGSDNVSVLLGDGRGGFRPGPGSPLEAGPKPHLIALGDFNRDGKLDHAVTEHDSNDVRVFLGTGDGRFSRAPGSPFVALQSTRPHNHGLVLGDVNADGNLDVTTANQNDNSISVLLGDGRGGFAPAPSSPFRVGRAPYPHALGDVNGDSKLDIVAPNVGGASLTVLLGDGQGRFAEAPGSPYAVTARPFFVALGDFDSDGKPDIVATHDDTSLVTVLLNDGRGRFCFAPGSPFDIGQLGWKLALGDVNGDSRLDLATGALPGHVVVFLGDGRGRFRAAPGSPYGVGKDSWAVALADLNRDAKLDVVAASSANNNASVLLGVRGIK